MLKEMVEVLRRMKHSRPFLPICPRCGSRKIHLSSKLDSWLMPTVYVCSDCGYYGPIVMEVEENQK